LFGLSVLTVASVAVRLMIIGTPYLKSTQREPAGLPFLGPDTHCRFPRAAQSRFFRFFGLQSSQEQRRVRGRGCGCGQYAGAALNGVKGFATGFGCGPGFAPGFGPGFGAGPGAGSPVGTGTGSANGSAKGEPGRLLGKSSGM
jgi:hypothetical protein